MKHEDEPVDALSSATAFAPTISTERGIPGPELAAGTLVDHFKVVRLLGRGGMGEVYLARDTKLGRKVALKLVHPELLGSQETIDRFLFEARATATFSHQNIVTIHHVGDHEGRPYLALEFVEGQELRERIFEEQLSLPETLRIAMAIAEALREAHAAGILHRDLKPENVIIGRDGRVRVLDFGLAMQVDQGELDLPDTEDLAQSGLADQFESFGGLEGTPAYMAPEQWTQDDCNEATDIWALGMVLFELVVGDLPYDPSSLLKLASGILGREPVPRVDRFAEVPSELADLIASCLEKDAKDRPTATAVAQRLEQLLQPATRTATPDSPFCGLMPFTERHAAFFFGRDSEIAAFVERMRQRPVLPVVGPSGAGKSSFVQAGVIARLQEQERWLCVKLRPGSRPFYALATRLIELEGRDRFSSRGVRRRTGAPDEGPSSSALRAAESDILRLAEKLLDSPRQLSLRLRALAERKSAKILLFVDQLEELVTLTADEGVRRRFVESVCTAADDAADPLRVVFALRDDYLGRLALGPEIREALRDVTVLQRPGPEGLAEMLRRPLAAVGHRFEDDDLVTEMVAALRGEPAGLPLLQFSAQLLWDRRDEGRKLLLREAYREMGGVEGALARHADGVLDGFSSSEVQLAHQLLLRLITPERTRRLVARTEALEGLGSEGAGVLERLTEARLISASKARDETDEAAMLELTHESLIRRWRTLSRWIDDSRDELAFVAEVDQAAELWEKRGRRPAELWEGDALAEALRAAERSAAELPERATRFLTEARRREERSTWRNRGLVAAAIVLLAVVALVMAFQKQTADAQRVEAVKHRAIAQAERAEALREGARAALSQQRLLEARAKLRVAFELEARPEVRQALDRQDSAAARALWWQLRRDPLVWTKQLDSTIYSVAFAPDGKTIAAACQDEAVYLFDTETRQARVLRGHDDQVFTVAFSPDGKRLASGGWGGTIRTWDVATGAAQLELTGHSAAVWVLSFNGDGTLLASGGLDQSARLWDLAGAKEQQTLAGHEGSVLGVAFSPDGQLLATASGDHRVRLWEVAAGKLRRVLAGHQAPVRSVQFDGKSERLVTASYDKTVRLWDVTGRREATVLEGHSGRVRSAAFAPDGQRVASGGYDKTVRLWDVGSGRELRALTGHAGAVLTVDFGPDGKQLATGGYDNTVRLWDIASEEERQPVRHGHQDAVLTVAFSPDGQLLASGGYDHSVRLWDVTSGHQEHVLTGHLLPVNGVSFSADGKLLASASADDTVRLWDVASPGAQRGVLVGHGASVLSVDFSPDGVLLASSGSDDTVRLWNVGSGKQERQLDGHTAAVTAVQFSPDGRRLASASWDHDVRLWNVATGTAERILTGHTDAVNGVSFSPGGDLLASAGTDKSLRVWDLESGAERQRLDHTARLYCPAFHPDGERVGASSSDGTARVWSLRTRAPIELRGHSAEVNALHLTADGTLAVTASDDGTVRLWDPASGKPIWRAPLLLSTQALGAQDERPQLLSHEGWVALSEDQPSGQAVTRAPARWHQAVEQRALFAKQAPAGSLLCVQTYDESVELWDLAADRLLARHQVAGLEQVLAVPNGCVTRGGATAASDHSVILHARGGSTHALAVEGSPSALGAGGGELLVAAGTEVFAFRHDGEPSGRWRVGSGVTAVTRGSGSDGQRGVLVVGYRDGNIELYPTEAGKPKPDYSFEQVPSSPVLRILAGPMHTLLVGFANGMVGIWSQDDGSRLEHARIHGQVTHLLLEGRELYVATDLGQHLVWDLGVLYADHCELLQQIWRRVPVVWEAGRPIEQAPPRDLPCRPDE